MRRPLRGALTSLLLFTCAAAVAARENRQEGSPRRRAILSLVSGEPALPWTDQITRGFVDFIESRDESPALYFEYLDWVRFDEPGYAERLSEWLRFKYRNHAVDLVVARGQEAPALLAEVGVATWDAIPVLYTELGGIATEITSSLPNLSGLILESHAPTALDTMEEVLPGVERVAFFYGATPTERARYSGFAAQVRAGGLEPLDLGGLAIEELLERVARLPEQTAIFFFPIQVDGRGKTFTAERVCELVSKAANRPMFSLYRPFLGCGVVGGLLLDFEVWGRALGERSLQVLDEPSLPTMTMPVERHARLVFDARQLARWGIEESYLPEGSTVEFREPSLWRDYRPQVVTAIGIGLVQAFLVAGLLLEHRRRRRAEVSARRHLATIAHVDRRGALGELAASLAHELGQPLSAILANAQAAELMLAAGTADTNEVRGILHDIRRDDLRAAEIIRGMRELLGKRELTMGPVDLNALIAETVAIVTPDAESRGIEIEQRLAPGLPTAAGERIYLQQVLLNLLLNGVAAVADEQRERRRVLVETMPNNGSVEITVSDRGHGIPEEQRATIFDPFVTTKERGLGMGLSIARSIVEAHGGTIEAANNPAGGATFRFRVPVPR